MEWSDEGIVLGCKQHGEANVVLEVMTALHGRHFGLVRGGRSRRLQPVLQAGNSLALSWRARLEDHLGQFSVELLTSRAARLIDSAAALDGLATLTSHLRLLPERDAHEALFEATRIIVEHLPDPVIAGPLIVRFELALLQELGFGLDLSQCAATGVRDGLAFVSPKTGRAVSAAAGEPFRDKLLALPRFIRHGTNDPVPDTHDIAAGFALTGYFLDRHVFEPRGLPAPLARERFAQRVARAIAMEEGVNEHFPSS